MTGDKRLLQRLDGLPVEKRQPNLLLAAPIDVDGFLDFVHTRWTEIAAIMRERSTQTNEPARCATLLPALIEAGASAGIGVDGGLAGGGGGWRRGPGPRARHAADGGLAGGVDLRPLAVGGEDDMAWPTACIWPEHEERRRRLAAAAAIARSDPPHLVAGDLGTRIPS